MHDWCESNGGRMTEIMGEEVCEFDRMIVTIQDEPDEDLVMVTDPNDMQRTDYKAPVSTVEFTDEGITGDFIGNMRDKDEFTWDDLK